MQNNFLTNAFQKNFLQRNFLQKNFSQDNFSEQKNFSPALVPYAEGVVNNFIMGVNSIAKKAKEVEEDARRRFCDYPSA